MILGAVIAAAGVGCALTFAPGDYGGTTSTTAGPDATASGDATPASDVVVVPPSEGGPPPPARHVLIVAGERDGSDTATSDVWSAPIDDAGQLGEIAILPPGPVRGLRSAIAIADGRLLVATKTNADRVVESAPFDGGLSFAWQTSVVANPGPSAFGQLFAGASFVSVGGFTTSQDPDTGDTVTTYDPAVKLSTPDAGVYPKTLTTSPEKLAVGLSAITFAIANDLVFFWGDGPGNDQRSKLSIARIDPVRGLTAIKEQASVISDPQSGKVHTPVAPIACAGEGRLFILGGDKTDVVVTATYDEAAMTIGSWTAGPKLPRTLKSAGCVVWKSKVYVFGGLAGPSNVRTDEILTSAVAPDGTMSGWGPTSRTLPGARSNVFALTY